MPRIFSAEHRAALSAAAKKRNRSKGYSKKHAAAISAGVSEYWERRRKLGLALTNRTKEGHNKHSQTMSAKHGHAPYKGVMREMRVRYNVQKADAKRRGILFFLSFQDWVNIWRASGQLRNRGFARDQYVMARGTPKRPDVGAYQVGNVRIITARENRAEQGNPRKKGGSQCASL